MSSQAGIVNIEKLKTNRVMVARILNYLAPYWRQMMAAIVLTLIVSLLELIPPVLIKNIVDKALPKQDLSLLCLLIVISVLAIISATLVETGETYINTWIAKQIIFSLKNQLYNHLQYMDLSFLTSTKTGEINTRLTSDIDGVQEIFNATLINTLRNTLVLITTALVLIFMNWKLAVLGIIILPIFIIPIRQVGRSKRQIAFKIQGKISELNQIIYETLNISGFILMKIFTREEKEYQKFRKVNEAVIKQQIKETLAGRWLFMTIIIFTSISPLFIYLYGGYLFIHHEISIGGIIAFVALLARLYVPVTQLSNIHVNITRSLALFQRIFDYFDQEPGIVDQPDAITIENILGKVDFEHVHFSYNLTNEVLQEINFSVKPGSMVAFVGPSGAGKTTVTNLIPRLYDPTSGRIKIDGVDIRKVNLKSLRQQIGLVMQDPYLFNDTIAENLRYGKSDVTEPEIIHACQVACIHDFIMTLPEKYDTVVGNRGIKLSGGEKQRISIARVILRAPQIIIFDEATSSLDSVSEMLIQQAMAQLLKGRTSFVIAHRLSTVLAADQILVMQNGQIAETGRHEELLEKNGLYKKLYDTQFKLSNHGDYL